MNISTSSPIVPACVSNAIDAGEDRNTKRADQPGKIRQKIAFLSRVKDYLLIISNADGYDIRRSRLTPPP